MEKHSKKIGVYAGYVGVTLLTLLPLEAPQVYYVYTEYNAFSSLLTILSTFASTTILLNTFLMPCSWTTCFIAIGQMLPQEDMTVRKENFAKAVVSLAALLMIATIVNLSLFYAIIEPALATDLYATIPLYLNNSEIKSAWDRAASLMKCCGASGSDDFISVGFSSAPCSGLGCSRSIVINFYILWVWAWLGQVGAISIGLYGMGLFAKTKSLWTRIKARFW